MGWLSRFCIKVLSWNSTWTFFMAIPTKVTFKTPYDPFWTNFCAKIFVSQNFKKCFNFLTFVCIALRYLSLKFLWNSIIISKVINIFHEKIQKCTLGRLSRFCIKVLFFIRSTWNSAWTFLMAIPTKDPFWQKKKIEFQKMLKLTFVCIALRVSWFKISLE